MSKFQKIIISILRSVSSPILSFLLAIIGIRFFGKENWGEFISIFLWVLFFVFLSNWGNQEYLIRSFSYKSPKMYNTFFTNFWTRTIIISSSFLLFLFFPLKVSILAIILCFLIHSYNALNSLIIYHQQFLTQLIAECIGFLILIVSFLCVPKFDIHFILLLYCFSMFIKIIIISISLKLWRENIIFNLSFIQLKKSFPFFLMVFTSWLISKIDLYSANMYLSKSELSEYQIISNAFIMLQSMSVFVILPFKKHLYRISSVTVRKIKSLLNIAAFPIVALGTLLIWILLEIIFSLKFNYWYYIIGGIFSLPCFFYTIDIINLLKNDKELLVAKINSFGIIIYITINLIITTTPKAINFLLCICITQWILLFIYKLYIKKEHNKLRHLNL